jgi:hypothetical protein
MRWSDSTTGSAAAIGIAFKAKEPRVFRSWYPDKKINLFGQCGKERVYIYIWGPQCPLLAPGSIRLLRFLPFWRLGRPEKKNERWFYESLPLVPSGFSDFSHFGDSVGQKKNGRWFYES